MTNINVLTDIPDKIITLEMLHLWTTNCLAALNPTVSAVEGENYVQRAAQAGVFYIASNNKYRHVGRTSIEMLPQHLYDNGKPWLYALPLSSAPLDPLMKLN